MRPPLRPLLSYFCYPLLCPHRLHLLRPLLRPLPCLLRCRLQCPLLGSLILETIPFILQRDCTKDERSSHKSSWCVLTHRFCAHRPGLVGADVSGLVVGKQRGVLRLLHTEHSLGNRSRWARSGGFTAPWSSLFN